MSAEEVKLHRQVLELAQRFQAAGRIVTLELEVSARTAAAYLHTTPGTMKNWRSHGDVGLPFRTLEGRTWYLIADLIERRDRKRDSDGTVIDTAPPASAESGPIEASTSERP
ncbi:MAG: hypothetical protein AB7I32_15005 [Gammaproteobacteria bacterium]